MFKKRARVAHEATMSWVGHLSELRVRLIRSGLALCAATVVGWCYAPTVLEYIRRPVGRLVFVAPAEAFMAYMQLALALGAILASPYMLGEAWLFVRPGLLPHEHRFLRKVLPLAYALFLLGGVVGYVLLFPAGVRMLVQLASGPVEPAVTVSRYLGVLWSTVLPSAVSFELPLAVAAVSVTGVVQLDWLRSQRGMALLLSFIFGGMLSPQGVGMQLLLAVPLFLLFELGLLLASLFSRRRSEA